MEKSFPINRIIKGFVIAGISFAVQTASGADALTRAIITVESNCKTDAYNPSTRKGVAVSSYGLGQLTLSTAFRICRIKDVELLYNKKRNLECTIKIVDHLRRLHPKTEDIIAAYNMGQPCVCDGYTYRYPNGKKCGLSCAIRGSYKNQVYVSKVLKVFKTGAFCRV